MMQPRWRFFEREVLEVASATPHSLSESPIVGIGAAQSVSPVLSTGTAKSRRSSGHRTVRPKDPHADSSNVSATTEDDAFDRNLRLGSKNWVEELNVKVEYMPFAPVETGHVTSNCVEHRRLNSTMNHVGRIRERSQIAKTRR